MWIDLPALSRFNDPELDDRIRHIFVLVLENRSFDHMLGAIPIRGTDAETGRPTETQAAPRRGLQRRRRRRRERDPPLRRRHRPEALGGRRIRGTSSATRSWRCAASTPARPYPPYPPVDNSGFAQNFADASPDDPCTHHAVVHATRTCPVITALAEEFVVCDNWFSSMPGPTWPNRFFFHAARRPASTTALAGSTPASTSSISGVLFDNGTIYDMLDSENIDWAVYDGDASRRSMALAGMDLATILTTLPRHGRFRGGSADGSIANYVFIEPDYGDDITGNTYKCGNSQHPLDDITHGERLIKRVYEAIRNSPLWGAEHADRHLRRGRRLLRPRRARGRRCRPATR